MGKLIFEGNSEEYVEFSKRNEADYKEYLAEGKIVINTEKEEQRLAEEKRLSNMTEEKKLIEIPLSYLWLKRNHTLWR